MTDPVLGRTFKRHEHEQTEILINILKNAEQIEKEELSDSERRSRLRPLKVMFDYINHEEIWSPEGLEMYRLIKDYFTDNGL